MHAALLLAGHVSVQHMGYEGAWTAGVFLDQLRGQLPSQAYADIGFGRYAPFPTDEYTKVVSTTTRELGTQPAEVVQRLMKPLLRGLGVDKRFLTYEHPAEITQRV